jgi:EmrB/QacA subfamily drug resistance transporter
MSLSSRTESTMTDLDRTAAPDAARGVAPPAAGEPGPRPGSPVLTVVLTSVAYFMVALDALVVITALPSIHRDLGGSAGMLQWTVSAYAMAYGAGIITAAALGDRLGRRRLYVLGLGVFTTASAACALAPGLDVLIAFRAVQGLGAAIIMPLGLTLLTSAFPVHRRGAVVGIWGGVAGLAVAAGPLVGGAVTQGLDWHWIFWVNVPVGVVALIWSRLRLPESYGARSRLDVPGLVLISAGVGVLIWGLVQGTQEGWGGAPILAALILGAALIAAFLAWEARAPEPMIPLRLFRSASFSAAVGTQFFMGATIFSATFLTSQFFQFARGDSPLGTGLRFLPWTATPLIVVPIAGALFDRVGARPLVVPGLAMQALGLAWVAWLAGTSSGYGSYVAPFIIAGIGISMAIPCVAAAGLNAVAPASLAKAAGVLNTMQQFGAVFGIAVVTAVFNAHGSFASPASVSHGYRPAVAVSAAFSVIAALTALGIRRRIAGGLPVTVPGADGRPG